MEYLDSIFDLIIDFGGNLFFNFMLYGFIGSMVGLIGTIYIMRKRSKAGKFIRPNGIWTAIVSIEKVYLPIVVMVALGTLSGIFGINSTIDKSIESSVYVVLDKMTVNVNNIEKIYSYSSVHYTPKEILVKELSRNNSIDIVNNIIATSILDKLGNPVNVNQLIIGLKSTNWVILNKAIRYGVSSIATDGIDTTFWLAYRYVFLLFVITFLKLPIIEFVIHLIYKNIFGSKKEKPTSYPAFDMV